MMREGGMEGLAEAVVEIDVRWRFAHPNPSRAQEMEIERAIPKGTYFARVVKTRFC